MTILRSGRNEASAHSVGVDAEQRRRVVAASVSGTIIEWYDFTLYGLAAALVFAPLYFPGAGSFAGTMAALGTFAVGLGVRPIGGLVFAHFGDRIGPKPVLLATLLVMGLSTTAIGLLPTAEQIGIWAPVLLVLLRLLQGAGAGAEFAGAITMVAESAHDRNRAQSASYPGAAIYVGTGGATLLFALLAMMPDEAFLSWGWRVPFLASALIIAVAAYLRLRVSETNAFRQVEEAHAVTAAPVVAAVRSQCRTVLCGLALFAFIIPWAYLMQVYVLSYVTAELDVPRSHALAGLIAAEVIAIPAIVGFARLADRIGRKPVLTFAAVFCFAFPFPMFWLLDTGSPWLIGIAFAIGIGVSQGATSGPAGAMLAELFETRVRWSGIAISREIPAAALGGTIPLLASAMYALSGGHTWPIASYAMVLSAIGFLAVRALPETLPSKASGERA